jgi:hypothetical protein
MNALVTTPLPADANVVNVVQEASILTGIGGSAWPTVQTVLRPQLSISQAALSTMTGAYNTAGSTAAGSLIDLSLFDPTAIGSSVSAGMMTSSGGSLAMALLLLDDTAIGAFQIINQILGQSQAIKAYNTT